jgi:signal transduction histidine kinase
VQELASGTTISMEHREALEKLLAPAAIGRPIVSFRIWRGDTVAFSNRRELIGRPFPVSNSRNGAWRGSLVAGFSQLDDDDALNERTFNLPLLEIYAPVHETGTGRIIAIAETYELAVDLRDQVRAAQLFCWMLIGSVAAAIVYFLLTLARRGSRERGTLQGRITELAEINAENESFRKRVNRVNSRVYEMHERDLRQFGSVLYAGPMQLVSLALLKLDDLHEVTGERRLDLKRRSEEIEIIREALSQSLDEIRRLTASVGPPELESLALADVIALAARRHVRRTGADLAVDAQNLPAAATLPLKACLFRFLDEALALSFSGADGETQRLHVSGDEGAIKIEVAGDARSPEQAGPKAGAAAASRLKDLRDRIEAFGGFFKIVPHQGQGMLISASFMDSASFNYMSLKSTNG